MAARASGKLVNVGTRMFGAPGGQRLSIPIGQMFDLVASQPMDVDDSCSARLLGALLFVDFFALPGSDGSWTIGDKTLPHTRVEMPTVRLLGTFRGLGETRPDWRVLAYGARSLVTPERGQAGKP